MLKQMCVAAQLVQNSIDTLYQFGYDPHIQIRDLPLIDRQDLGLSESYPLTYPRAYSKNGGVLLNLALRAIDNYSMDYECGVLSFSARFGGVEQHIVVPVEHIVAVTSGPEGELGFGSNPQTFVFIPNPKVEVETPEPKTVKKKPSFLSVVK